MMRILLIFALFLLSFSISAQDVQTLGVICPTPSQPCDSEAYHFEPHELSFKLPAQLKWQTAHYSEHFYAVILRSVPAIALNDQYDDKPCKGFISETERSAVQAQFPKHKVFTSRNGCFPMVFYTNTNDKYNFVAVYAGKTETDAKQITIRAQEAGFSDANLRKMQVFVDNGH